MSTFIRPHHLSIAAFISRLILDKTLLKAEANSNLISPITASIDGIMRACSDIAGEVANQAPGKEADVAVGGVLFSYASANGNYSGGAQQTPDNDEEPPVLPTTPRQ